MIRIGLAGLVTVLLASALSAPAFGAAAAAAPKPPALLDPEEAVETLSGADASPYEGADRLV
ncbi:MAG: hypothetical protein ABIJ00_07720, partial [Candidatus Eisenbacteria bacterium]